MSYTHFTLNERKFLQELLDQGYSFRKIAALLGRSPSSVSREVNRNKSKYRPHKGSRNQYRYQCWRAQNLYVRRRRAAVRFRLVPGTPEWDYIIEGLQRLWSPEQICFRWRLDHPGERTFSVSTIYRYLRLKMLPNVSVKENLRRRGKRILPRSSNYNTIHPDRIIPDWPEEIVMRARIGDWEGDTVYGGVGKGLLVTLVDRRSRLLRAALLPKRDAALTRETMVKLLRDVPVCSISLDNGSEFSEFRKIEKELNTEIYFAEPHKPWQRGTNENTNDLLRFFFPKGFDFRTVTQEDVDYVVDLINSRPRKCLGFRTPYEVFFEESGVALA